MWRKCLRELIERLSADPELFLYLDGRGLRMSHRREANHSPLTNTNKLIRRLVRAVGLKNRKHLEGEVLRLGSGAKKK